MSLKTSLLVRYGFVPAVAVSARGNTTDLGTILGGLATLGFAPSADLLSALSRASRKDIALWWTNTHPALKKIRGADVNMEKFVVYKNFPAEVLEKTEAEYWIAQILMYIGLPNDWFTEEELPRAELDETLSLRILHMADDSVGQNIADRLLAKPVIWTEADLEDVDALLKGKAFDVVDFSKAAQRANAASMAARVLGDNLDVEIRFDAPTDILRTQAALSGGDVSLRVPTRVMKLSRPMRRVFTTALAAMPAEKLRADFAARPKTWKKLLHALHAGQDKGALGDAARALRAGTLRTFDSDVERLIAARDRSVLSLLAQRPGNFARRLHKLYGLFGTVAFERFSQDDVLSNLTNGQLLKLVHYFETATARQTFLSAPRGNMARMKVRENTKADVDQRDIDGFVSVLRARIGARLDKALPNGVALDPRMRQAGLPANGQEGMDGRGTVYTIPEGMSFLRTASYWEAKSAYGNIWYDNGWTFFDASFGQMDATSWDHEKAGAYSEPYGVFSGDPTNFKEKRGRACQMIDVYIDRAKEAGVRYGVWSVLCFSHKPFSEAEKVLATLQWGENAEKGKLYEPSRAQIVLPLTGEALAKAVAVLDVEKRELIFLDTAMGMHVSSAARNSGYLAEKMPAVMDMLAAHPSYHDLFACASKGTTPIVWDDADAPISGEGLVMRPTHPDSDVSSIDVFALLDLKD
jgi:hypothetical protein